MKIKKIAISSMILGGMLLAALTAAAVNKSVRYRHRRYHHVVWNPVLRGSHDSMTRQNQEIDRLQLPRIADEQQLLELEHTQELVPIPESRFLRWSKTVQADKRYSRPWTRQFVEDLSEAYYNEFHVPMQINSAVRTMEQQQKLRRHNRNAAPEMGDMTSSHLAGTTVDLARRGLTPAQHQWMEGYLKNMRDQALVEAAEERRTWCFHVMVSNRYSEWKEANQLADKIGHE